MGKSTRQKNDEIKENDERWRASLKKGGERLINKKDEDRKVLGLESLDYLSAYFVRNPDIFKSKRKTSNEARLTDELATHLFGKYKTPPGLSEVWLRESCQSVSIDGAIDGRKWYAIARSGGSLIKELKGFLSRKEVNEILGCRHSMPLTQIVRWAICRSSGASDLNSLTVAKSEMAKQPINDFWRRVLILLSHDVPKGGSREISDICDFLVHGTLREKYSLSGKTGVTLAKDSKKWHDDYSRVKRMGNETWAPVPIGDLTSYVDFHNDSTITWNVRQITSAERLAQEGNKMRHCVYSYKNGCVTGRLSIWSLSAQVDFVPEKTRLTVEVSSQKHIVQARGLANRVPKENELKILKVWAEKEGLTISQSLLD